MSHPKIYVAGPYSKGDTILNIAQAIDAGEELLAQGLVPFIPHLTGFWHLLNPRPYEDWLAYDMEWLQVCDALLRLPGESSGADAEVKAMVALRKPVFFAVAALLEWARGEKTA